VAGLEAGADDYVVKPVTLRELVLRLRAHGRHARPPIAAQPPGAIRLDVEGMLAFVDGEPRLLTRTEFELLRVLATQPGRALTRRELREQLPSPIRGAGDRAIDTQVRRLRRKLAPAGRAIQTVRGVGYRYGALH
jgi:two-component system response regulator BaeR